MATTSNLEGLKSGCWFSKRRVGCKNRRGQSSAGLPLSNLFAVLHLFASNALEETLSLLLSTPPPFLLIHQQVSVNGNALFEKRLILTPLVPFGHGENNIVTDSCNNHKH